MVNFIIRRSLWMLLVLFVVSLITFSIMHAVPGGPFTRERALPDVIVENLNRKYNLDAPLIVQYLDYVGDIIVPVFTGPDFRPDAVNSYLINIPLGGGNALRWVNFGPSYTQRSQSINELMKEQLPVSMQLGAAALTVAIAIGVPLGIIAALNRNSSLDFISTGLAIVGVSVPVIVLGPIMQYIFGVQLMWLPVSGWQGPQYVILPAIALGFAQSALLARLTRASLLQVLHEDYIRTARAKGLRERLVVTTHALRNALIPVVTVLGPLFAILITGSFVTETIFSIPGLGRYFITSITSRDYPAIMGTTLLFAFFVVFANTMVDIVYAWIDPRIRLD